MNEREKEMKSTDYLVIGSGIAGLSFALKAARHGKVAIITKRTASESNTTHAQGGIACVTASDDNEELHVRDTLVAGAGICDEDAVRLMVKEASNCIRELLELGVDFTRNDDKLDLGREGGHSRHRILHCHDMTGKEVEQRLLRAVKNHHNIRLFENHLAIDLMTAKAGSTRQCFGAWILDEIEGNVHPFKAAYTVLCTGGAGQVYQYTTNPAVATGDGVAMAWRAGAQVADMEFVQFHPTTLHHQHSERSLLITEALRGAGAILINDKGEDFMQHYHPLGSLAPRDIVSRAIFKEMQKTGASCVYLSTSSCETDLKKHFPLIYEQCIAYGIDITKDPIPVTPTAHYMCGGVLTDLHGRTSLRNLYAFGEVARTGVHGANRLASNSLLEALVFSQQAYLDICSTRPRTAREDAMLISGYPSGTGYIPAKRIDTLRSKIKALMWNHAGITRELNNMTEALMEMRLIEKEVKELFINSRKTTPLIELYNLSIVARLILEAAIGRKESVGLHYLIKENDPIREPGSVLC